MMETPEGDEPVGAPRLVVTDDDGVVTIDVADRGDDRSLLASELAEAVASTDTDAEIRLWMHAVDDSFDDLVAPLGLVHWRDLWQMRCPLPAAASELTTRAFTADDVADFVRVNNRAFDWHPEQGGLTTQAVEATMSEAWFDPEGFRLLEDDGALIGFCWTKVHADHDPVLGEIYVIAIDPSAHGRGLGVPMTLAGLEHLSSLGITVGMLYVESDNAPAIATYHRIGFERHHVDRAWRRPATPDR